MKNITYLFMVYKNADFVRHTFERLKGDDVRFFVHVDKKARRISFAYKKFPTYVSLP